jgi:hypothetical protein
MKWKQSLFFLFLEVFINKYIGNVIVSKTPIINANNKNQ